MSKISISELAEVLVIKNGLEQKEAERFVATVFDVIQNGLERENIVKVKGLGTFKIIGVEARESVNVNTGERVVIDSHGKITFTPDATMKELVNKPFSQFETVVLNEGIEFEDMKEEKTGAESDSSDSEFIGQQETVEETLHVTPDSSDVQSVASDAIQNTSETTALAEKPMEKEPNGQLGNKLHTGTSVLGNTTSLSEDNALSPEIIKAEEQDVSEVANVKEPASDISETEPLERHEIDEEDVVLEEAPKVIVDTNVEARTGAIDVSDDAENSNDNEKDGPISVKQWILFGILAVVLVIGAFGGGYFFAMKTVYDGNGISVDVESEELNDNVDSASTFVEKSDTTIVENVTMTVKEDTKEQLMAEKETEKDSTSNIVTDKKSSKTDNAINRGNEGTEETFDSSKYDMMDNRVRTGAYRIVGTDHVRTVKSGETLHGISRQLLGEGMTCYIEVYNGLERDAELKAGQKIKIPKLELKKRNRKK